MRLVKVIGKSTLLECWMRDSRDFGYGIGTCVCVLDTLIDLLVRNIFHFIIALLQIVIFDRIKTYRLNTKLEYYKQLLADHKDDFSYRYDSKVTNRDYYLFMYHTCSQELKRWHKTLDNRCLLVYPYNGILFEIFKTY